MSQIEIFLIAAALSVDACVCSVIYGKNKYSPGQRIRCALELAGSFGLFQFMMPVLGFFGGRALLSLIDQFDHWMAFILLTAVAYGMAKNAVTGESDKQEYAAVPGILTVLSLAVATSIDALAVGLSIGMTGTTIFYIAFVIGIVCFSASFMFFMAGQMVSGFTQLSRILNFAGAAVLFFIGVNVLVSHGVFDGLFA